VFVYRRNLPHIQRSDFPHSIDFNTYEDWTLPAEARDLALKHCLHDNGLMFYLHAAVIMPNHVHLLLTPSRDERDQDISLATITNRIKGASAHSINKQLEREGHVWQDESFDHIVRSDEEFEARRTYIMENPVAARLVENPSDYQWLWVE